jgi:hypothetical protein
MRKLFRRFPFGVVYVPDEPAPPSPQPVAAEEPPTLYVTTQPSAPVAPKPAAAPEAVRFDWLCEAAHQPGKAAHLAVMLAWQAAQTRSAAVRPGRRQLRRFGVSRDACYDGLRRLEEAKLVHVWRLPGRLPQVILVEPGTDQPLRLQ